MKRLLLFLLTIPAIGIAMEGQNPEKTLAITGASFSWLPGDVQRIIQRMVLQDIQATVKLKSNPYVSERSITDLQQSIQNIAHFARINKSFNAFINDPKKMKQVLIMLGSKIIDHNELSLAQGLKNMRGIQSAEIKQWIVQRKNEIPREEELVCASDNVELDTALCKSVSINAQRRSDGSTVLIHALNTMADIEYVKRILSAGINVDIQNKHGLTALMVASSVAAQNLCVEEILKYNPNINLKDNRGRTALDKARDMYRLNKSKSCGRARSTKKLLKEYVQKNSGNKTGNKIEEVP